MFKKMKMATKASICIVLVLVICLSAVFSIALSKVYTQSLDQAEEQVKQLSSINSQEILKQFNEIISIEETFIDQIEFLRSENIIDRKDTIRMMKEVTNQNPSLFGISLVYEPNAFDGKDKEHINAIGSNNKGIFMPYYINGIVRNSCDENPDMKWYDIPKKTQKPFLTDPTIYKVNGEDINMVTVSTPIIRRGKFVGVVSIDISTNYIQGVIGKLKPLGGYCAVIDNNGRYVANGRDEKLIGKELVTKNKSVVQTIKDEKNLLLYENINGTNTEALKMFMNMKLDELNSNWNFLCIVPKNNILDSYNSLLKMELIVGVISLIITGLLVILMIKYLLKGLEVADENIKLVANGDLTGTIPEQYLKREDEVGSILKLLSYMQQSLKNIVQNIINQTTGVENLVNNTETKMSSLKGQLEDISATTEEMSAGVEETAASVEEINSSSLEIEKAAQSVASRAEDGAKTVNKINIKAKKTKDNFDLSRQKGLEVFFNTKSKLEKALEQSNSVKQIDILSESIMEITSQINLLALNAAIEAARAGDAGRGFAVVADEIRKLAENSTSTVEKIQDIAQKVVKSVENLSSTSQELLVFVNTDVQEDYDNMLKSIEQYTTDTQSFDDLVNDFSATSQQLLASIENVSEAMEEIATSNNESVQGVTNIAERTSGIVEDANKVLEESKQSKKVVDELVEIVSRFKM